MRAMTVRPLSGSLRSVVYSVAGYLGMLGLGKLASSRLDGGDSFIDLGVAAMTMVLLAPLAALVGAAVAYFPYRGWRLSKAGAAQFWLAVALVVGFVAGSLLWLDLPTGVTALLIGSTALLIMRVALIERQGRFGRLS